MNTEFSQLFSIPESLEQLRIDSLQPQSTVTQGLPIPEPLDQLQGSMLAGRFLNPIPLEQISQGITESSTPLPLEVLQAQSSKASEKGLPVPKPLNELDTIDRMAGVSPVPMPLEQMPEAVVQAPEPISLEELEVLAK
jgi:hypothetical protein